ncbi:MAG: OpgC domain-containing protein [Chloroflexi bacterium]|nr:OpgC domain-containing protein [Chloroflexota bacterium]
MATSRNVSVSAHETGVGLRQPIRPFSLREWTAWVRSWAYPAGSRRDLRIDFLRGFCVFAMIVDHIGGDSWLYLFTGGNRFFVSAAEGFVFISGLVMGQAYARKIATEGLPEAMLEALRRARKLYLTTVTLTLFFVALYLFTNANLWVDRSTGLGVEAIDELIVGTLTLHFTYNGTDILNMYTILILASPLLFLLLSFGAGRGVLIGSWLLWWAYQHFPAQAAIPWPIANSVAFPVAAWQVLFVSGLTLGYHRDHVANFLCRLPRIRVLIAFVAAAIWLIVLSLFWVEETQRTVMFLGFNAGPDNLSEAFEKVQLRPGRLMAFAALGILSYVLTTIAWKPISSAFGWLLLPLGQNALYAYIMHFFFILLIYNVHPESIVEGAPASVTGTLLHMATIVLLWWMVKRELLFRWVPR